MGVILPLVVWIALLILCRLPWWYKRHLLRRKLLVVNQGFLGQRMLWLSLPLFHLVYLGGLSAQLIGQLPLLATRQLWFPPLWWRQLAIVPLALGATINSQGLLVQFASLYHQSRQNWLPPQRGRTGRWGRVFWLWIYLPAILTQLFVYAVVLPQTNIFLGPLLSLIFCCVVVCLLTILIRGTHAHTLLGSLALALVNGLLILARSSVIVPMINCVFYLYWVNFITLRSK